MPSRFDRLQASLSSDLETRRKLAREILDGADAWGLFVLYKDGTGDASVTASPDQLEPLVQLIEDSARDILERGLRQLRDLTENPSPDTL